MSMEFLLATGIGFVTACAIYLMLRGRSFPVVLGLSLFGYAVNVFIFVMGRLWFNANPILVGEGAVADLIAASLRVRDWVNTPTEDMGPQQLEDAARALADAHGAQVEAITGDELLKQNFPAIHAVGRASHRAPRLIVLRWGKDTDPSLVLVGKGVCFDTGGLDIKPADGMRNMKKDMGGAAHALALARLVMQSRLPIRLTLLIAGFNPTRIDTANRHLLLGRVTLLDLAAQIIGLLAMIALAVALQSVWALVLGSIAGSLAHLILLMAVLPGADARALPVLVHLEGDEPPRALRRPHLRQPSHAGAAHELVVADGAAHALAGGVVLPVHPGAARGGVEHQLEQMVGHAHRVGANRRGRCAIHRAGEHKHIAFGAHHVFARVLFDACPRPAVVFGQLRHHVGQRKTLRHALDRAHVARRGHVPARIPGVFVIVE